MSQWGLGLGQRLGQHLGSGLVLVVFIAACSEVNDQRAPDALRLQARNNIIEEVSESISQADGVESRSGDCAEVRNVSSPIRGGSTAFRHLLKSCGRRAELRMRPAEIGKTYWYGWSTYLPADWDSSGGFNIIMQLSAFPSPRNGKFPCGGIGHKMSIRGERIGFDLQHPSGSRDIVCDQFSITNTLSALRGKWTDFVMHAKWTGNRDGFLKLWMKVGEGQYEQKIDYQGATWWNDEGDGPEFKMGSYTGSASWSGPDRVLYTDEYRLGNANATFDDVAPGDANTTPIADAKLAVTTVRASAEPEPENRAANAIDGDLETRWSARGEGQWLQLDVGTNRTISSAAVAWHQGDQRRSRFALQVSTNANDWTTVYRGESSGGTVGLEPVAFAPTRARYVRLIGNGNSGSSGSLWTSVSEVELYGKAD